MQQACLTAAEIAEKFRTGATTATAETQAALARIDAGESRVGAFLSLDREGAAARAAALDRERPRGALAGVPVAVKDNIAVRGQPCTCASRMLAGYRPPYDAHVAERLLAAGAVIVGKTNLDEFAMGSSTENSALGQTRNPIDPERVPGGSSGGSAAAVAAGYVPLALGSDTGGSIRQPASFCGVVGFKPSYGLVSRYGLVAFGSSLDQIGTLARTVGDAALLMDLIAGGDGRDATSRKEPPPDFSAAAQQEIKDLRIGLPKEYFSAPGLAPEVRERVLAAVETLKRCGATTREISLPRLDYAVPTYYVIATAEAGSNLARYDGAHYGHRAAGTDDIIAMFSRSRAEAFGPEVKRRVMLGTYVLSAGYYDAYYLRALKVRTLIAQDFAQAFAQVDVIASPVSPTTAFRRGEKTDDPLAMYLADIYTISANLAGIPALSVPCGTDSAGLPVGLQLMAARWNDAAVFRAAGAYERAR